MIKVRLSGTKKELRWFLKGIEKDRRYDVENVSTFKPVEGDERFRRLYLNVRRNGMGETVDTGDFGTMTAFSTSILFFLFTCVLPASAGLSWC